MIWTPAGIAVGALLARGRHLWPGIWLGALVINAGLLVDSRGVGAALLAGGIIAAGATLSALMGARLLSVRQRHGAGEVCPEPLLKPLRFPWVVFLMSAVSACIGTATLYLMGWLDTPAAQVTVASWWIGDSLGSVLITPVMLALFGRPAGFWRPRRVMLGIPLVVAAVLLGGSFAIFGKFDEDRHRLAFEREAAERVRLAQQQLDTLQALPVQLADFIRTHERVGAPGLNALRSVMAERHPGLRLLGWEPAGRRGGRASLVGEEDAVLHAAQQLQYLAWPAAGTHMVALARGQVLHGGQGEQLVLLAQPIKDRGREGYALVLVGIPSLGNGWIQQGGGLVWRVDFADTAGELPASNNLRYIQHFQLGGLALRMVVEERPLPGSGAVAVWWLYLAGLLCSVLLCSILLAISESTAARERLIQQRNDELARAHREAERAVNLLKEAVESIEQGFTIYDENDRLVLCNEAYRALYEHSRDLIVPGASFEEIVRGGALRGQYAGAIGRVDEWVRERVIQHQSAAGEVIEQALGDGRWLMIVEYRTPSGYIAGNRIDITPIKQAAQEIADRNAQLDALFLLSPDGFVAFDRERRVKFANPAFFRMTGLPPQELRGMSQARFYALLNGRRVPGSAELSRQASLSAGEGGVVMHLLAPGTTVQIEALPSDAPSIGEIIYMRDVSREFEVNRMKSEFLAHAAHELRTPMTSVLGFSELLLHRDPGEQKRRDILEIIHRQTRWLVDIINELLDLSRIEARQGRDFVLEQINLSDLAAEVAALQPPDAERWPLTLDCANGPVMASVDVTKMRQSLINLLANARKYSPDGGPISLRVADSGGEVLIEVRDSGIGMNRDELASFGQRFWRADRSGKTPGTGLGVAIVKEIVQLHRGRFEAESAPGQGTTVRMVLPAALAMAA